jgi:hypothetical protein
VAVEHPVPLPPAVVDRPVAPSPVAVVRPVAPHQDQPFARVSTPPPARVAPSPVASPVRVSPPARKLHADAKDQDKDLAD